MAVSDWNPTMSRLLPAVVDAARIKGYRFVNMEECLYGGACREAPAPLAFGVLR